MPPSGWRPSSEETSVMVHLDDGVEKLQSFCGLLAQVNDNLRTDTAALEAREDGLERIEDSIEHGLESLDQDLDGLREGLDRGEGEAVRALEEAAQGARRDEDRLDAEESELREAEATFDERVDRDRVELEQAGASIQDGGLTPLEQALDEADHGLSASGERADADFEALGGALDAETRHFAQAAADAEAAAAGDASGVAEAGETLAAESERAAQAWNGEMPDQFEEAYGEVAEALSSEYRELSDEATSAGEALLADVRAQAEDSTDAAEQQRHDIGDQDSVTIAMLSLYLGNLSSLAVGPRAAAIRLSTDLIPLAIDLES